MFGRSSAAVAGCRRPRSRAAASRASGASASRIVGRRVPATSPGPLRRQRRRTGARRAGSGRRRDGSGIGLAPVRVPSTRAGPSPARRGSRDVQARLERARRGSAGSGTAAAWSWQAQTRWRGTRPGHDLQRRLARSFTSGHGHPPAPAAASLHRGADGRDLCAGQRGLVVGHGRGLVLPDQASTSTRRPFSRRPLHPRIVLRGGGSRRRRPPRSAACGDPAGWTGDGGPLLRGTGCTRTYAEDATGPGRARCSPDDRTPSHAAPLRTRAAQPPAT